MQPVVQTQSKGSILHNYAYQTYANTKQRQHQQMRATQVPRSDHSQDMIIRKQKGQKIRIIEAKRSNSTLANINVVKTSQMNTYVSNENSPTYTSPTKTDNLSKGSPHKLPIVYSKAKDGIQMHSIGVNANPIINVNISSTVSSKNIRNNGQLMKPRQRVPVAASEFQFQPSSHYQDLGNKSRFGETGVSIHDSVLNRRRKSSALSIVEASRKSVGSVAKKSLNYFDAHNNSLKQATRPRGTSNLASYQTNNSQLKYPQQKMQNTSTYIKNQKAFMNISKGSKSLPRVKTELAPAVNPNLRSSVKQAPSYERVLARKFYDTSDPSKMPLFGNPFEIDHANQTMVAPRQSVDKSPSKEDATDLVSWTKTVQYSEKKPRILRDLFKPGQGKSSNIDHHQSQLMTNMTATRMSVDIGNEESKGNAMSTEQRKYLQTMIGNNSRQENNTRLGQTASDSLNILQQSNMGLETRQTKTAMDMRKSKDSRPYDDIRQSTAGSIKKKAFSINKTDSAQEPSVYQGAYELSMEEHQLKSKLHSHLQHRHIPVADPKGARDSNSPQLTQSRLSPDPEKLSAEAGEAHQIAQELKRLQRSTIKVGNPKGSYNDARVDSPSKAGAFFNPKYFDPRLDRQGNLKPARDDSTPVSRGRTDGVLKDDSPSKDPKQGRRDRDDKRRSRAAKPNIKANKDRTISVVSKESLDEAKEKHHSKVALKREQETEMLYSWAPGTRKKPISKKFDRMIDRFINPNNRHAERRKQEKELENVKYFNQLTANVAKGSMNMQKLERRILKAEQVESKKKYDEHRGFTKLRNPGESSGDDSAYQSSNNNDSLDSEEERRKKEEDIEDVFVMNEVQIHEMLAEAVAGGGEVDDNLQQEFDFRKKPIEMTDKQRIRCLLMVQLFFSGLGDANSISLKDQIVIANRCRVKHAQEKKELEKEEAARRKQEKADARKARLGDNPTGETYESSHEDGEGDESGQDSNDDESNNKGDEDPDSEQERKRAKRKAKRAAVEDAVQVNTQMEVKTESKAKRQKLDDAVRKILLFKDMKLSETKGDLDPNVKLNQDFIKATIAQYSGSITAPSNIVGRKLHLSGYYLNEGVCKSLSTYFSSLTFDQLQEIDLSENGLKDTNMAQLLAGLSDQRALRNLSYSDNEMGPQTAEEIAKILLWPNPTNLERLSLKNLRTTNYAMAIVLHALKTNRKLVSIDIEKIQLNNGKNFEYLGAFLKSNKSIKSLRLSWCSFLPKQIVGVMNLIKRKKTLEFLDLSNNNLAPEPRSMQIVQQFVNAMRRFIPRTQIFHLNLNEMSLGKTVAKLVPAILKSSTLNVIHLGGNMVPLEIVYRMDADLGIPEALGTKIRSFRPVVKTRRTSVESDEAVKKTTQKVIEIEEEKDNGNMNIQTEAMTEEEVQKRKSLMESKNLKEDLMAEVTRLRNDHFAANPTANQPTKKNIEQLVTPLAQEPLIYQRILNHPEFVFPVYFMAKPGVRTQAHNIMESIMNASKKKDKGPEEEDISILDQRQDTVYFSQNFTNKWSKIEPMTNKQIKKGKKGVQPDFSGVLGREGIVNTHHETCWVCEKRKYVFLSANMDPDRKKQTWGAAITNPKEKAKLKKKYLTNSQLPGNLNKYPILISSLNDWFPVHLMPVLHLAMLFDYTLVQDIAKDSAMHTHTQDSVDKFKQGYKIIMDDVQNIKKFDPSLQRLYKDMWRNYILKNLIYPHDTLFIDFPAPDEEIDPHFLFMYSGFVKPGKHRALLYDPMEDVWYKRDFFVDEREEELPKFAAYDNVTADKEQQMNSILKDWKNDSHSTIRKCIEHDEQLWKIGNVQFIKDPSDYEFLRALIFKHFSVLKEVFLHVMAKDEHYPSIGIFGTEEFSKHLGLMDGKHVKKETVDRMFIAANVTEKSEEVQNPINSMIRYEFIEFLVRMAKFKYKESGLVATCTESFERLMQELVLPYWEQQCQGWQPFREKYLQKTIIDNLMHANKRSLETVFIKITNQQKKPHFGISNARTLEKQLNLSLTDTYIQYCFGMSMATVENETKKSGLYDKLIFSEYVEFLCRILHHKFVTDTDSNLLKSDKDLNEKMEISATLGSGLNSARMRGLEAKSEDQKKAVLEKHLVAFKEYCCRTLDPFFEGHGLELVDPDEDPILADSEVSEYEDDLEEGYNSQAEDNPKAISVMSSGNSSESEGFFGSELMKQSPLIDAFRRLEGQNDKNNLARISLNSMGLKIIEDGADSNKLNMNRMKPESTKVHDKIRADSARRRRKELMEGAEDSK